MALLRTFFAVELGDAARAAAGEVVRALRRFPSADGVRWVRGEALHVTLRFLGATDPAAIPALARDVCAQVAAVPAFTLALGAVQLFPSPRRPRVVALHVHPEAPLAALARSVEAGVVAAGFAPETRAFRAHLTLGRVLSDRASARRALGPAALPTDAAPPPPPSPFPVREAVLFESRLGAGGSTYLPLVRLPLGGSYHPQDESSKE